MAFQDDMFWAVAGGAAPVIALAAVVLLGQVNDQVLTLSAEVVGLMDRFYEPSARPVKPGPDDDEVQPGPDAEQEFSKEFNHANRIRTIMLGMILALGVNLVIQCVLLAMSLVSLTDQRNLIAPVIVTIGEVAGIALLAACTFGTSSARGQFRWTKRKLQEALGPRRGES